MADLSVLLNVKASPGKVYTVAYILCYFCLDECKQNRLALKSTKMMRFFYFKDKHPRTGLSFFILYSIYNAIYMYILPCESLCM